LYIYLLSTLNVEALASGDINPDCPNGCMGKGDGCHCYRDYDKLAEAKAYWAKHEHLDP